MMLRDAEAGGRCSVKTYGDRCASVERVGACVACRDPRVNFRVADAQKLPVADASFERPAAGLVINLYPIRKSD
jgi:ubiquinone/menaquinone biosynthesis C-methylase UbiE